MAPIRDWTGAITISPPTLLRNSGGLAVGDLLWERGKNSLCDMVVEWEKVCNFAVSIWCCAY